MVRNIVLGDPHRAAYADAVDAGTATQASSRANPSRLYPAHIMTTV